MSNKLDLDHVMLAFAIKDKKFLMELTNSITEDYFSASKYRNVYSIIADHFTDPRFREIPTFNIISERLAADWGPNHISKVEKFHEHLLNMDLPAAEFTWYLDKLKSRYNTKLQKDIADSVTKLLGEPAEDEQEKLNDINMAIREATVNIDAIYKKESYKEGALDESAEERLRRYEYVKENPTAAQGILSGYSELDRRTGGLHPGELMIIAGGTGSGKSVVMHNIGVNAYLGPNDPNLGAAKIVGKGSNILYFSLEMPKESIERRIDACMGGFYYNQIRDGAMAPEDEFRYKRVLDFQLKYANKFHIVDMAKGVTTREVELKFIEISETNFVPDLVIIDYLGIMSPNTPGDSDWLAMGKVAAELHEFARTYEIPVITGSQVNRPPKDGKADYSTNRIARSDTITHNANIILQIASRDDEDIRTDMEVFIIKMRDGEKGAFVLTKDFAKMKILDLSEEGFIDDEDGDEEFSI